jgi:hypothetical protein
LKSWDEFFGELGRGLVVFGEPGVRSLTARARRWASARAIRITGSVPVEFRQAVMAVICASRRDDRASIPRSVPRSRAVRALRFAVRW